MDGGQRATNRFTTVTTRLNQFTSGYVRTAVSRTLNNFNIILIRILPRTFRILTSGARHYNSHGLHTSNKIDPRTHTINYNGTHRIIKFTNNNVNPTEHTDLGLHTAYGGYANNFNARIRHRLKRNQVISDTKRGDTHTYYHLMSGRTKHRSALSVLQVAATTPHSDAEVGPVRPARRAPGATLVHRAFPMNPLRYGYAVVNSPVDGGTVIISPNNGRRLVLTHLSTLNLQIIDVVRARTRLSRFLTSKRLGRGANTTLRLRGRSRFL